MSIGKDNQTIAKESIFKLKDAGSKPLELGADKLTRSDFVTFEVIIERNLDRHIV